MINASISPLLVILELLDSSDTFLKTLVALFTEAPKSKTELTAKKLKYSSDIIKEFLTILKAFWFVFICKFSKIGNRLKLKEKAKMTTFIDVEIYFKPASELGLSI